MLPTGREAAVPGEFVAAAEQAAGVLYRAAQELVLHLDTGDQPTNGLLYPVAAWLRHRTGHDIRIGFAGEHTLVLRIRNNLARMLWAYMRAK